MLDSAANSVGNIDIISVPFGVSLPYDLHILAVSYLWNTIPFWCFLEVLTPDVLSVGFSSKFRRKHRHNFVPFGFSLPYDLQILVIFSLWNTLPFFGAFWGF